MTSCAIVPFLKTMAFTPTGFLRFLWASMHNRSRKRLPMAELHRGCARKFQAIDRVAWQSGEISNDQA
jgi:hypothetical protein